MRPAPALLSSQPEENTSTGGEVRERIFHRARARFFACGYSAFTMDDLAGDLGMSKKTLYIHFRSKDTILRAVIDRFAAEVRADAEALLGDRRLTFSEKLRGFAGGMIERLGRVSPAILHDLQRFAPDLHRHIEQVRGKNLPYIFGRFIEEGQTCGAVRDDINPVFASEFYLHAMQGLMNPDSLRRLHIAPEAAFENAIRIFFGGLLTPSGHKEYEKVFPR